MEDNNQPFIVGQRVVCTVERIYPYGIFVRLNNETRGYIRRRELSWSSGTELTILLYEGQMIEAVITELANNERTMELSLRATMPDPWVEFSSKNQEGDLIEGVVKDLMPYGVFVEILPGVDGFVHLSELATWKVSQPDHVLWIGDNVEAVITRIVPRKRKIRLSIRQRMLNQVDTRSQQKQQKIVHNQSDISNGTIFEYESRNRYVEDDLSPITNLDIASSRYNVGGILVVDNNLELCKPFVTWLRRRGYNADLAMTPAMALELLRLQTYKVLFVDIDLPEMDGLDFIQKIKRESYLVKIAIMSIPESLRERTSQLEMLNVADVFAKPLDLEDVERFLARLGRGEDISSWRATAVTSQHYASPSFTSSTASLANTSLLEQLQSTLTHLIESVGAETGIIFATDPNSQAIVILVRVGSNLVMEDAIYSLEDSPVKDVLRTRQSIFETHISAHAQRRFRKLLDLLSFESCIGIPIETQFDRNYALFLFHSSPDAFNHFRVRDTRAVAIMMATIIERDNFQQYVQKINTFLLNGQLAASFEHEVNNQLSGVELQIRNLQSDYSIVQREVAKILEESKSVVVKDAIDVLLDTVNRLKQTVDLFQGLMRAKDNHVVDVNSALQRTQALMYPLMIKNKVQLRLTSAPHLPPIIGNDIRLQQVFLNIVFNALQHISTKTTKRGIIEITTFYEVEDNKRPVKIRISDSGVGIHKQLWEKIFSLGFSTRRDGTGLGLFVARTLIESMGGTIFVEQSKIFFGTTFLIQLPAVQKEE